MVWTRASPRGCEETLCRVWCGEKTEDIYFFSDMSQWPCDQWLTTSLTFICLWWLEKKVIQNNCSKEDLRMSKSSLTCSYPPNMSMCRVSVLKIWNAILFVSQHRRSICLAAASQHHCYRFKFFLPNIKYLKNFSHQNNYIVFSHIKIW